MFRKLSIFIILGSFITVLGCHPSSPAAPSIAKDDYQAIILYLQKRIPEQMRRYNAPGLSIALINDQEIIWTQGFGYADEARGLRVSPNTAFRAGALSQLVTTAAVLQLVDQGRLTLNQPVKEILPEFSVRSRFHSDSQAADRDITIRRLLSHQSGLPSEHFRGIHSTFPISEMPMRLSGVWLSKTPGTKLVYSNMDYALLGAVVERLTKLNFEPQLQLGLLAPLGMSQSSFIGINRDIIFRAQGYRSGVKRTDKPVRDLAASGLWTSPKDLSRFVRMLFAQGLYNSQRVLSKASINEMFTEQNNENTRDFDCKVGLGWRLSACGEKLISLGVPTYYYSAEDEAFVAQLTLLPDQQLSVIIMVNDGEAMPLVKSLSVDALRMMLRAQNGEDGGSNKELSSQTDEYSQPSWLGPAQVNVEGTYATASGIFTIKRENGQLYGALSGNRFQLKQDNNGWIRVQKKIFSSRQSNLGEWGRLPLKIVNIDDRIALIAQNHRQSIQIGELIKPVAMTDGWLKTTGSYQVLNPDENEQVNGISVRVEGEFLVMRAKLYTSDFVDYILIPVDSTHARLAGSGNHEGDIISRSVNGLTLSGYHYKRDFSKLLRWIF